VGVDLNPGMLDVARAHTPTTGVPVEWRQGDLVLSQGTFSEIKSIHTIGFIGH
jgi:2-polyprenyl-3-methyl-5-hydroxy-6-metoxy-1,4-benzoquinol methylase